MDLFVRLTESYDTMSGFVEKFADQCDKLVVYEHDGARRHIHLYAVSCRIKTDAIKARIKKYLLVNEYDKSNWSFKSATDAGCITYMSKGIIRPRYVKGFTDLEIEEYTRKWIDRAPEVKVDKKKDTVTQYDMAMEVYDIVKEQFKNVYGVIHTQEVYRSCLVNAIAVCRKHRKGFDEYSIRKIVHPAYTKFEHCQQQFVEKSLEKFFS